MFFVPVAGLHIIKISLLALDLIVIFSVNGETTFYHTKKNRYEQVCKIMCFMSHKSHFLIRLI